MGYRNIIRQGRKRYDEHCVGGAVLPAKFEHKLHSTSQYPDVDFDTCKLSLAWQLTLYDTNDLELFLYLILASIYNVYFHTLASFPGPILARSGLVCLHVLHKPGSYLPWAVLQLWRLVHSLGGKMHLAIDHAHQVYGDYNMPI